MGIVVFLITLHFLPSILAGVRKHNDIGTVFVLNLFLGWTLIGWVVALAWASSGNVKGRAKP